ncbi:PH domain-containing protein [Membranihabitans maritimus]|uniref:PH domain-containing protein n=1 Tax=Membranihabitans maritimus TaxID=2904244 RepID=UPI001F1B7022|nr:PH domain-containing protein [Membranihabitans maritimus]
MIEQPSFSNRWVDPESLPRAGAEDFTPVESEYLYVRLTSVLIFFIVGGVLVALFVLLSSMTFLWKTVITGGFLLLILLWGIYVWLEFRQRGYAVREQDVSYRRGLIFRTRQYLPFRRIQHCKISESMLERLFNFATIVVSAAGDDIVINGLRPEVAQSLQTMINDKVDQLNKEMKNGE